MEEVPSGISSSGCERGLFGLLANGSLTARLVAVCRSVKAREVFYGRLLCAISDHVCVSLQRVARVTNHKARASVCEASSCVSFCEGERVPSWSIAWCFLMLSADYQKGLEKIVLERKKESMHSAWIGQLVAESLGGSIDSRKEIDLWLLQLHSPK